MYLSAAVLFAASLALYGACGFVAPAAPPASTEVARGSAAAALTAGEQGADVQTTSAWSPLAIGAALGLLVAVAGAIPAFGEKLGPDDIEDVATYVFNKAAGAGSW